MTARGDDYLWDPAQPPDAELAALERALRPLRRGDLPLDAARLPPQLPRGALPPPRRWRAAAAALAVAAALLVALWFAVGAGSALAPGASARAFVTAAGKRTVQLGGLASIELGPDTELAFEHWRADQALFRLRRGGIGVRVAPPPAVAPKFFCVDTPRGRVVDLGCKYELRLQPGGGEYVRVTEGAVEFAYPARTVFVPAGASCSVDGDRPATPLFTDRSGELAEIVGKFDAMAALKTPDGDRIKMAELLAQSCNRGRDTLPLWHLLRDPLPEVRDVAEQRLLEIAGAPPGALQAKGGKDAAHAEPEEWLPFLRMKAWLQQ